MPVPQGRKTKLNEFRMSLEIFLPTILFRLRSLEIPVNTAVSNPIIEDFDAEITSFILL